MKDDVVRFVVPAKPEFARSVRMLAASLGVICRMSVDDVEDIRMAAEEGFVYACSTGIDECQIEFSISPSGMNITITMGDITPCIDSGQLQYAHLLLETVCDQCVIEMVEDLHVMRLGKTIGGVDD